MAVLYMDLRNAVLDFGMGLPGSIFKYFFLIMFLGFGMPGKNKIQAEQEAIIDD